MKIRQIYALIQALNQPLMNVHADVRPDVDIVLDQRLGEFYTAPKVQYVQVRPIGALRQ